MNIYKFVMLKINLAVFVLCMSNVIGFSAQANWNTLDTKGSPTARHENGMVAHDGKVYVVGGRRIKPIDVYDPVSNSWFKNKPTPFEMHHITPVSVGDKILVVTGLTGKYPKELPFTHVWEYNPKKDTWHQGFEIPESRRRGGAGVTVYQGKVYIVGGIKFGHTSGTTHMVDVYDPVKQTWGTLTDAPHIRDHSNAVVLDNKLIAFGGRNTSYHEPESFAAFFKQVNDKVDVYDFVTKEWRTLKARLPIPTAGAGAIVHKNKLYYVGGEHSPKPANNRMVSFDFVSNTFKEEATLNQGRHGTNAVLIGNKIYFAMGSGNKGGGPELNSIEVFSVE